MVWRKLGPTTTRRRRSKIDTVISLLPVLISLLMFDVLSGVEGAIGRSDGGVGAIFWITGGGGVGTSGGYGSQSNVGLAIAVTVMAGLAVAATLVYSNR